MSIDYKLLLEKYIRHVAAGEDSYYINSVNGRYSGSEVTFSDDEAAELKRLSKEVAASEPAEQPLSPTQTQFRVRDDDGRLVDLPGVINLTSYGNEDTLCVMDLSSAGFRLLENKNEGDEIAIQMETPGGTILDLGGYVTKAELHRNAGSLPEFIFSYKTADAGTPKVLTVAEADQLIRNTLNGKEAPL